MVEGIRAGKAERDAVSLEYRHPTFDCGRCRAVTSAGVGRLVEDDHAKSWAGSRELALEPASLGIVGTVGIEEEELEVIEEDDELDLESLEASSVEAPVVRLVKSTLCEIASTP